MINKAITRTLYRKRQYYTQFKNLPFGARFRLSPAGNGPFVKSDRDSYEDARIGDDTTIPYVNRRVRRLWAIGIEPN